MRNKNDSPTTLTEYQEEKAALIHRIRTWLGTSGDLWRTERKSIIENIPISAWYTFARASMEYERAAWTEILHLMIGYEKQAAPKKIERLLNILEGKGKESARQWERSDNRKNR